MTPAESGTRLPPDPADRPGPHDRVRLERLRRSLAADLDDPSVRVVPFRGGVDCFVDLVQRDDVDDAVVRSAVIEHIDTTYEGHVDFGRQVEREVRVIRLLHLAGIPVPTLQRWHRGTAAEDPSWMLSSLVTHAPSDTVPAAAHEALGRLARQIHDITPIGADRDALAADERWSLWITRRILRRLEAARRYMELPSLQQVEAVLRGAIDNRDDAARSLLHLDLRGPNVAIDGDRVVALFDFGNSRVGDPYLELARVEGCGLLSDAFLAGYGTTRAELDEHGALLKAYGLDLHALLVVVSTEEFDDPDLHEVSKRRTRAGLEALMSHHAERLTSP